MDSDTNISLLQTEKYLVKLVEGNDSSNMRPWKGASGTKCAVKARIDVPTEKEAAAIITYLNSPIFRAEFDAAKPAHGMEGYGMDVGRIYPIIDEKDGKRTVKAYVREIKLTRSI
jgi:hypothetical protein